MSTFNPPISLEWRTVIVFQILSIAHWEQYKCAIVCVPVLITVPPGARVSLRTGLMFWATTDNSSVTLSSHIRAFLSSTNTKLRQRRDYAVYNIILDDKTLDKTNILMSSLR